MVGMDAQMIYDNSTEKDGVYGEPLEPCAQPNGDAIFQLEASGTPPTSAGSESNTKGSALCPITPVLNRETGDSVFVTSTPLSLEIPCPKSPPNVGCFQVKRNEVVASVNDLSPRTPDEGVFDPFAPGPDEMLLAPICKKLMKESRKIVARQLSFDDVDFRAHGGDNKNVDSLSENMLLESFYGTLLEAIILKQSEEFYAENQSSEMKGAQTPTSPQPLTGVAETCPGAPMKNAASKFRVIDPGLCRKLEF